MFWGNFFVLYLYFEILVKLMEFYLVGRMIKKMIEMEMFCLEVFRKVGFGVCCGFV